MAVYMVLEPPPRAGEAHSDPERFRFHRDRFSILAFAATPLWLIWNRLWLALLVYAIALGAVESVFWATQASGTVRFAVGLLIALFLGLEAGSIWRWTHLRRGWRDHGIVIASNLQAAEHRFFDAWTARPADNFDRPTKIRPAAAAGRQSGYGDDVVGLFPRPGLSR